MHVNILSFTHWDGYEIPILYFMGRQILSLEYDPFGKKKIVYIPENTATDDLA